MAEDEDLKALFGMHAAFTLQTTPWLRFPGWFRIWNVELISMPRKRNPTNAINIEHFGNGWWNA
jgi:hypothetical protein